MGKAEPHLSPFVGTTAISEIVTSAKLARDRRSKEEWERYIAGELMANGQKEIAHLCPFTERSFRKPRGYSGDAVVLDYIYGINHPETEFPKPASTAYSVFQYTSTSPAPKAVRYRRNLLAIYADETARSAPNPRILSIAAGHLREIELSEAAKRGEIAEWVAIDQDPKSLETIARDYAGTAANPMQLSVKQLLFRTPDIGRFQFTYAAGLFDYLEDNVARALVAKMLFLTESGGTVLIANFLPDIPDVGYMESFMDWHLIFRTREEISALFSGLEDQWTDMRIHDDPDKNIAFAIVTKR